MKKTVKIDDKDYANLLPAYMENNATVYNGIPCYVTGIDEDACGNHYAQITPAEIADLSKKKRHKLFADKFIQDMFG